MEAPHFRDEPLNPDGDKGFMALNHVYTMFQEENFDLIHEWRMVLEEFKNKDGHTRYTTAYILDTCYKNR